jgi:LEA14-like dessication related protein
VLEFPNENTYRELIMKTSIRICLWLSLALLLNACAALTAHYQKPQVNITSFSMAPYKAGLAPRFEIGIQIINPNSLDLPFKGMSYAVEIEGHRILSGATGEIPTVPAYGQSEFKIEASPDLFGSARLISELFSNKKRTQLNYAFSARLDAGRLLPVIVIDETGEFKLSASDTQPE